jgi:hypothetical protein
VAGYALANKQRFRVDTTPFCKRLPLMPSKSQNQRCRVVVLLSNINEVGQDHSDDGKMSIRSVDHRVL